MENEPPEKDPIPSDEKEADSEGNRNGGESELLPCPGMDVVGRGLYLQPRQPYKLKGVLFSRHGGSVFVSQECHESFRIPEGYVVNDSPPMPADRSLNKMVVEESLDHITKQTSFDAQVASSNTLFSIDASGADSNQEQNTEAAYYAQRTSFIPFWSVYLDDTLLEKPTFDLTVPPDPEGKMEFDHENRAKYDAFFNRFGTHFVTRAWVGGKATLAFTVMKSAGLTKAEVERGLQASLTGIASGSVKSSQSESQSQLQSNSQCTVWGKGGDRLELAKLASLNPDHYDEWLKSIPKNPGVLELEVAGIWTLLDDPKQAKVLQQAYQEATYFPTLTAIFPFGRMIYFLRGDRFLEYNLDKGTTEKPKDFKTVWPDSVKVGFGRVDAAFAPGPVFTQGEEDISSKVYFFRADRYVRFDYEKGKVDDDYPRPITEGFPGVTFENIDAVVNTGPEAVYFFSGNEYIRFNMNNNRADKGYPALVTDRWPGMNLGRIDAAFYWGNGKVYFFKDDQHVRFDMVTYETDPGYPRSITGSYVEDWKFFD